MPVLLMTRPPDAARRFAEALPEELRARLTILFSPLLDIRATGRRVEFSGVRGLIFTSANGVAAADAPRDLPAFCVGEATAAAAARAGYMAHACGGTADALVEHLLTTRPDAPLLHLRGAHARGDVSARLSTGGLPCSEQVVYEQALLPLTDAARTALLAQAPVIVPLFSPRSAAHFSNLCPADARPYLIALSPAVAEPLKTLNYKDLQICSEATAPAMQQAVQDAAGKLPWVEGRCDLQ
jgi:uroporphyrinogen-III synthase